MSSSLFNSTQHQNQTKTPQFSPQQIQMAKQFLSGKNMTAEQAVRMICQQRGIDVNSLLSQFK